MRSGMIWFLVKKWREAISLTDTLFFDTDCLCAFLWVGNESLLPRLYPGKTIIPRPVYTEICKPTIPHLKARIDTLLNQNLVTIQEISIDSEEYEIYYQLTEAPKENHKIIGNGEAASISLAKKYGGIVASNNLSDIQDYISEYHLQHTTTADILVDAYNQNIITESQGNTIWANMLAKRRRLGAPTFTDYLKSKQT